MLNVLLYIDGYYPSWVPDVRIPTDWKEGWHMGGNFQTGMIFGR